MQNKNNNKIGVVSSADALHELCQTLAHCQWIAVDTEFQRDNSYYPKLCLIQVATEEQITCIDPLAFEDLTPFFAILQQPRITKVFHAARQDLEAFYHLSGNVPAPIFDTQLAAPLLGYQEQIGYASLVKQLTGTELRKDYTRSDWTQRPLPKEQLHYAADDVLYLVKVYLALRDALVDKGRLDWLAEDFAALENPELYKPDPGTAWIHIKGADKLRGTRLSVLQTLAQWREHTAMAENRPRGWVIKDIQLIDSAKMLPKSAAELGRIRGMNEGFVRRHGDTIMALIDTAKAQKPEQRLHTRIAPSLTNEQDAVVDMMMALVRLRGAKNGLNPAVLTSRRDLARIVAGDDGVPVLAGWRSALVGADLMALLEGRIQLFIQNGGLYEQDTPLTADVNGG